MRSIKTEDTPEKQFKQKQLIISGLTLWTTTLLGFLNVYSWTFKDKNLISAQTGNLILFGTKIANGNFSGSVENITLILGFALGCSWGPILQKLCHGVRFHMLLLWLPFCLSTFALFTLGQNAPVVASLAILSFDAGYLLTLFREFHTLNINNGIMTGNLKNFYTTIVKSLIHKDHSEWTKVLDYFLVIFAFFCGTVLGGKLVRLGESFDLNLILILGLLPLPVLYLATANLRMTATTASQIKE